MYGGNRGVCLTCGRNIRNALGRFVEASKPYRCPNCGRPRDDGEEWCTEKHTKAAPR